VSTLGGRCAIVTGGATGIGLGITRRLLADGARVLIAALTGDEL
jgi:NAD(P)-dependent dehydrogenase (short-subunit alcohol dehydrogenase family)